MGISPWHIWMFAAVIFILLEMFTPSFFMACIGIGCAAGGVGALLGGGAMAQLLLFSLGTLAAFLGVRPLVLRYFYKKSASVRTNVDGLAGRTARVSERVDPATGQGRVVIDGDDWKAATDGTAPIEQGEPVVVVKVDSVVLTVRKLAT
ncbi:MAG: NfeD family protein [Prevotellaceae bacterium]|jgi:membrane protein implicated in regulation of membrane protease activity|nr:NfeD family protein [Prevotellaceae bacterium]